MEMPDHFFNPFISRANGLISHQKSKLLAKSLEKYELKITLSIIAGISTVPHFQANSYRIELLTHLIVACCSGRKIPAWQHVSHWLNRHVGDFEIVRMEDPSEDTFVVNVITPVGDFRVLTGLWEAADSATTLLIETLTITGDVSQKAWLEPAIALLRLSDSMIERAGLSRWHMEDSVPRGMMKIVPASPLREWSTRVVFNNDDLTELGIDEEQLRPFIFNLSECQQLLTQNNEESTLHRKPLVKIGNEYVLALPNAITYATRLYILQCAFDAGQLEILQTNLMGCAQRRLFNMTRFGSRHRLQVINLPEKITWVQGICSSIVVQVGTRRFLHFLMVADDLNKMTLSGLRELSHLSTASEQKVDAHINSVRDFIDVSYEVDSGHTFWLMGFLGQGFMAMPPQERTNWTFESARLDDLEMLFRDSDGPVDRLIFLSNQKQELEKSGLTLPLQNGLLNLYAFWIKQNFHLRVSEIPHDKGGILQIGSNFVADYRRERRMVVDEHCEPSLFKGYVVVQHGNEQAVYQSLRSVPSYVSLNHIEMGLLSFCLKHQGTTIWLTVFAPSDAEVRNLAFKLWEALQLLLHRTLSHLSAILNFQFPVLEILIDLRQIVGPEANNSELELAKNIDVRRHLRIPIVKLIAEKGFIQNFNGVDNIGERLLLSRVIFALCLLSDNHNTRMLDCNEEAINILGGSEARIIHGFRIDNYVDYLLSANPNRTYQEPTEHMKATALEAFTWLPSSSKSIYLDREQSIQALNQSVKNLAEKIVTSLNRFDRIKMISMLFHLHETLLRERKKWKYTARAVIGLYGTAEGTNAAAKIEQEHTQLKIAIRALIEAAICECSVTNGLIPDEYSIDELIGLMVTLTNLGRESDIIYYKLGDDGITIYPNGGHSFVAQELEQVTVPYHKDLFGEAYSYAAANYENWVGVYQSESTTTNDSIFNSPEFLTAWHREFGLTFHAFREIAGELQDLGFKHNTVVVQTTIEEIASNRADEGVTVDDVRAFVNSFGLNSRQAWLIAEPPYKAKDINPWRFERRLSLSLKPIVIYEINSEKKLIYGVGSLRQSLRYVLDSLQEASFDKDVFKSKEMRALLGKTIDSLGWEFTNQVASLLRAKGWSTKTELKLTQLYAPKLPNLGDIDVLAWRSDGQVLIIECKRLKRTRTIAEIALACERFKGNVNDHLYKHIRRVNWSKDNIQQIANFTKLAKQDIKIRYPLVVSRPVPFKYLQGLPIPAEEIVNLDSLSDWLQNYL
jgi:hypothetical protein